MRVNKLSLKFKRAHTVGKCSYHHYQRNRHDSDNQSERWYWCNRNGSNSQFDLPLNCHTAEKEKNQDNGYSSDSYTEFRGINLKNNNKKLWNHWVSKLRESQSSERTDLHRHSSEEKEVKFQQANHNLVPLVHSCRL